MLCSSVTCAVHSANRTHHAGHVGFHTRAHVKNPSSPNPTTQPDLCPSAGSANPPRAFPDRVLTLAAVHTGVSPVARHGPPVRCRVDPGRSRSQLPPLPGICPAIVAVAVSTHTGASRRPDCTQHSNSHTGDVGRHAGACGRVSRCGFECSCVQYESRDTREYECEACVETETATMARQMPGSGSSCNWDRAGSARWCTGSPCRATYETPACTAAKVRPGPETHVVD